MKDGISFNYSLAKEFIPEDCFSEMRKIAEESMQKLVSKTGEGNDFLGWLDVPVDYDREEFDRIINCSKRICETSDVFLVIGIGGSYLGARAAIDFLRHTFYNSVSRDVRKTPEIYFVGNNISDTYYMHLMDVIAEKDVSVNVISKSGTTTESAIGFRIIKDFMYKKYGSEEAAKRIYVTTDKERGALKNLAVSEGYETFVIPDDIGGRFSVLSAVGLLPIAVSGADIKELMRGAQIMRDRCLNDKIEENDAVLYAIVRNILYNNGKQIEILANYEPAFHYLGEWWKQLYAESEGKDHKGIFTATMDLTTDLHSIGQFVQDGTRILFETVIDLVNTNCDLKISEEDDDIDGLNYLAGETIDYVNKSAMRGTQLAHMDGGVPCLSIIVPDRSEKSLGELFYFFEFACGVSGYILGVNPFNQPGVEAYKKNMFTLLGKPGFEEQREELLKRIPNIY